MPSTQESLVLSSIISYLQSKEGAVLEYGSLFGVFSLAHSMHNASSLEALVSGCLVGLP